MDARTGVGHAVGQIELSGVAAAFPVSRESGDGDLRDCAVDWNHGDVGFLEKCLQVLGVGLVGFGVHMLYALARSGV